MKNFTKILLLALFTLHSSLFTVDATNVSGGIYSNTTWTLVNSPYIVTDTVVVFPGVTLTIEPGVVVKFDDHIYLEIRGANLIANGTALDSITFTSNNNNPTPGIWGGDTISIGGIWIHGTNTNNASFNFCNVFYGTIGISEYGLDTFILRNSNIKYNKIGIYSFASRLFIDTCNINNNSTEGLKGQSNNYSYINFSNFLNNKTGIWGVSIPSMNNCIIDSNQTGIYLNAVMSSKIMNCEIKYNYTGIIDFSSNGNKIKNCTIDNNTGYGIWAGASDSIINCEIKNNTNIGIRCNYPSITLTQSIIENNGIGIDLGYANLLHIYCNKICNNISYNINYLSVYGNNMNIANNYWCSTDSATIHSMIYDGYININLGLVSVFPIDTVGCYLTGCNLQLSTSMIPATCDTCHTGSASVSITNGHAPYTFTWNSAPIQTTQTATNLASGTYTVCVADANGCTACQSVYVDSTNCSSLSITLHETNSTCINCTDGKAWAVVTGGSAPYSYTWYSGPFQYTDTAINLLHGTYIVCVTDAYGCVVCDSITIGTGNCSANFLLYPDTTLIHHYWAVNQASGVPPLTYDWNWGDNSIHDFTANPSHIYANQGSYTICLTITDSVGCQNEFCQSFYLLHPKNLTPVTVNVIGSIMTGINSQFSTLNSQFSIYPNPNDGNFILDYHFPNSQFSTLNSQFLIKDVLGRTVYTHYIYGIEGKETIDVSGLNNGIYFYQLTNTFGTTQGKFIIEK